MPSTMIIMPAINKIVAQLIPPTVSAPSLAPYQNAGVKMLCTFNVDQIAGHEPMQTPNTSSSVAAPHPSVTTCRSILSKIINTNMTTKIDTATHGANPNAFIIFSLWYI